MTAESDEGEVDGASGGHFRIADVFALLWVVAIGVALLLPAFIHGSFLGPFDIQSTGPLTHQSGVVIHNRSTSDQIAEMIPWTTITWQQVHSGTLPLWNPYSGMGLPLAFNWQSAPLALPTMMGYLVPVRYAYDVAILMTLLIAGSGAYVLARLLRLGVIASVLAATTFELSGPLTGWLGFPHAEVMAWGGWLLAAILIVLRGGRRIRGIAFLAVVVAATIYSGQPEVAVVMFGSAALFGIVLLATRLPVFHGSGAFGVPLVDLVIGSVTGAFLAAPFALPGLQVVSLSARSTPTHSTAMTPHDLMYLISQGFDGLPIAHQAAISLDSYFYNETAAYIGVIAAVLAGIAIVTGIRRPEIIALTVVAFGSLIVLFTPWARDVIFHVPLLNTVGISRFLMPAALSFAVLAAYGLDHTIRHVDRRAAGRLLLIGFGIVGIVLAVVYVPSVSHLDAYQANERRHSFVWPGIETVVGLLVATVLMFADRLSNSIPLFDRRRVGLLCGGVLLAVQSAFLLSAGAPMISSSSQFLTPTTDVMALQQAVGSARIGYSTGKCAGVGLPSESNDAYHIHQLDAYDPIIPQTVYRSWEILVGTSPGYRVFNLFCPRVTSATVARLYGVQFLLQPAHGTTPTGTRFVEKVGPEDLFEVPGSGLATLVNAPRNVPLPPVNAPGIPVAVAQPDPATWHLSTSSPNSSVLRLRLTDLPGWTATIDGRPLKLSTFAVAMLQARIPAGNHTIELHYWPELLTLGLLLAVIAVVFLLAGLAIDARRHRE